MQRLLRYFRNLGIALSILFNALLGGSNGQSFSARNYELKRKGKPNLVVLIDKLFWFDDQHSLQAWSWWVVHKGDYE